MPRPLCATLLLGLLLGGRREPMSGRPPLRMAFDDLTGFYPAHLAQESDLQRSLDRRVLYCADEPAGALSSTPSS